MLDASEMHIDPQQLDACLGDYQLRANEWTISRLSEGVDNLNLLLESGHGRRVLRRYDRTPASEVVFEVQLIDFLRDKSFPTPGIYKTVDGALLSQLGSRPVAIFEYVVGRHGKEESIEDAEAVARLLARLHHFTVEFKPPCSRSRTDVNRISQLATAVPEFGRSRHRIAEFVATANALVEKSKQQIAASHEIPFAVLHHDPNPANVLFDTRGDISALLDFDESHVAPRISDLIALIHYWAKSTKPPFFDIPRAAQLIHAYEEGRALSVSERQLFPHYVQLQYAADAAEYLTRQLIDCGNSDVDIDSCISYCHFVHLAESAAWIKPLLNI